MSPVKRVVVAAVCAALGVVLPMAFHAVPGAGNAWLPMHLPVMVCGLVAGPAPGAAAGLLAPVLSSLLTGMPAGRRRKDGTFTRGSLYEKVDRRLTRLGEYGQNAFRRSRS